MKQEGLKERVELLEIGERLGYPRLGYGRSTKIPHDKRIPAGKDGWERFAAHAHVRRILPALRIGRVLRDNNVFPFHPPSGADLAPKAPVEPAVVNEAAYTEHSGTDLLDDVIAPEQVVTALPRKKKGGHKKPPHPLSKRAQSVV